MKKTSAKTSNATSSELRAEYSFDYRRAKPNRFAARDSKQVTVTLEPDVAEVFTTQEAVNKVLRALIKTMPRKRIAEPR